METVLESGLICYSILITYIVASYYRKHNVLEKRYDELLKTVNSQKAVIEARIQQENDLDRQLNNLFNYNGTSIGQVKRGDD